MSIHGATPESESNESPERTDRVRATVWTIAATDTDCDHPPGDLRRIGDDGRNVYYQCTRCENVFVSREEIRRLTRQHAD